MLGVGRTGGGGCPVPRGELSVHYMSAQPAVHCAFLVQPVVGFSLALGQNSAMDSAGMCPLGHHCLSRGHCPGWVEVEMRPWLPSSL